MKTTSACTLGWRLVLPPGSHAKTNADIDTKGSISNHPPTAWRSPSLPRDRHKAEQTHWDTVQRRKMDLIEFTVLFGGGCNAQGKTSFLPAPLLAPLALPHGPGQCQRGSRQSQEPSRLLKPLLCLYRGRKSPQQPPTCMAPASRSVIRALAAMPVPVVTGPTVGLAATRSLQGAQGRLELPTMVQRALQQGDKPGDVHVPQQTRHWLFHHPGHTLLNFTLQVLGCLSAQSLLVLLCLGWD